MSGRTEGGCAHPAERLHAWWAYDGTLCVACCDCGAVLAGAADDVPEGVPGEAAEAVGAGVRVAERVPGDDEDAWFYVQATLPSGTPMVRYRQGRENAKRFYDSLAPCPEKRWGRNGRDIDSEGVGA